MSEVARFADLATTILAAPPRCGRVRLVAIDGPGGAGKSVFAARLAKALGGVPVVETDDFASWENPHDWWDRLEADVLESLERGQLVRYQAYDWAARRLGDWRDMPASDIVIVEGVSSSRRGLVDRLSMAIWLETPRDQRLARGISRDGEPLRPQWDLWMAEEDAFFERDGTRDRADLIVDGSPSEPLDPDLEFITA
jgi:uridine kinase